MKGCMDCFQNDTIQKTKKQLHKKDFIILINKLNRIKEH